MPRYVYSCNSCEGFFQVWHGMKETEESCQLCLKEGCLTRIPQMPSIKKEHAENSSVGSVTNNFIKENKDLLDQMKKEARSQTYDD